MIHDDDEQDAAIVADLFRKINNKPVVSEKMSVTQLEIPIKARESTRGERNWVVVVIQARPNHRAKSL